MVEFGDVVLACVCDNDIFTVAMLILKMLSYLVSYWNNVVCDRRFQTVDIGWLLLMDGSVLLVVTYDM